jgi:acetylornithine/succinyldiaminopimelate/putrescine aminotransferase
MIWMGQVVNVSQREFLSHSYISSCIIYCLALLVSDEVWTGLYAKGMAYIYEVYGFIRKMASR